MPLSRLICASTVKFLIQCIPARFHYNRHLWQHDLVSIIQGNNAASVIGRRIDCIALRALPTLKHLLCRLSPELIYIYLKDFCRLVFWRGLTPGKGVFPCENDRDALVTFRGGGGGAYRGSEFPASRTLYSRFPPPSLVFPASVCFFYCEQIAHDCKIYFLFLPAPAPLAIPSPALSSPISRRLLAPIALGFLPPCPPPLLAVFMTESQYF